MRLGICVATVSLAFSAASARGAGNPSLCQRLAERAEDLKGQIWANGSKTLRPALEIDQADAPSKGFELDLAQNPAIRQATDAGDGQWTVFIDHLAGTDLYAASTSQGTLHCQTYAFARARPGSPVTLLDGPSGAVQGSDGGGLCWTRTGNLGRVFGHPVFIEHGANDQVTDDEDLHVTAWMKGRWAATCVLKLRFQPVFAVTQRQCGDDTICAAADRAVLDIADAYHQKRQNLRDNTPFRYVGVSSDKIPADIQQALEAHGTDTSPPLPKFACNTGACGFSYSGLSYFPLDLHGRTYVAAIGHEGVGWRETSTTLFAIYLPMDEKLIPQASYEIDRSIGGLKAASAE